MVFTPSWLGWDLKIKRNVSACVNLTELQEGQIMLSQKQGQLFNDHTYNELYVFRTLKNSKQISNS